MEHLNLWNDSDDVLIEQVEQSVLAMIKTHNPDWVEEDGSCTKCLAYYESLDDAVVQQD